MDVMLPTEVRERMESRWNPIELKLGIPVPDDAKYFEPARLVYFAKSQMSRCNAWVRALKTRKAMFTPEVNGWRKCHTENYWCYYAKILPQEANQNQDDQLLT